MSELREGTAEDRERLAPLRAAEWRKYLSVDEYVERNRRLYRHAFGRERMTTWIWEDPGGQVISSLDTLAIKLQVADGVGGVEAIPGVLIASVITPAELRGQGHGARFLRSYFDRFPDQAGVLFSDISPLFYERYGFVWQPQELWEANSEEHKEGPDSLIPEKDFLGLFSEERRQLVGAAPEGSAVLEIDPLMWDWHLERYRLFHELRHKKFLGAQTYALSHGDSTHLLAAVADPVAECLDVLWGHGACQKCQGAMARLAWEQGLLRYRVWRKWFDGASSGQRENPMIRLPHREAGGLLADVQFVDWW